MTVFWLLTALLIGVGVLFVAIPLLRGSAPRSRASLRELNLLIRRGQLREMEAERDAGLLSAEQYERAREELERSVLEEASLPDAARPAVPAPRAQSQKVAIVLAVLIPLLTVGVYFKVGSRAALVPGATTAASPHDPGQVGPEQIAAMVQGLADRLKEDPEDPEGWMMLGRSYAVLERFQESAEAYARARALLGDQPDVLSNYADALAMANGGKFTPESVALIERALQKDPSHSKSLWLMGTVYYEQGKLTQALELWERLASLMPPDARERPIIEANLAEVRNAIREAGGKVSTSSASTRQAAPAAHATVITGTVELAPALKGKLNPNAVLFIFARAPQGGPRMPLAIQRLAASDLPVTFTLDESMAMSPQMSLAAFEQVTVGARLSASGTAMAQSGDLQGFVDGVAVGSQGIKVVISEIVP
ncbi:MAG: c-type cytochrome biogenesis protein CcmI [Nitrospirota bacterium]|nr:c-type cytochrome biogenesis protein CcmI [Nitrospirota bacterium]